MYVRWTINFQLVIATRCAHHNIYLRVRQGNFFGATESESDEEDEGVEGDQKEEKEKRLDLDQLSFHVPSIFAFTDDKEIDSVSSTGGGGVAAPKPESSSLKGFVTSSSLIIRSFGQSI